MPVQPATRKRILALTLALVLVVPLSALAAKWQWSRHLSRDDRNAHITAAIGQRVAAWDVLLADGLQADEEWRRVNVPTQWVAGEQYLVRKQVVNGATGFTVVQGTRLPDGRLAYVLLGWTATAVPVDVRTLPEQVVVRLRPVIGDEPVRPADLPEGQINRVDPQVLGNAAGLPVLDAVLELVSPVPTNLIAIPLPELDGGPHVSYTGQWILIGITGVVVYVILVRREFQEAASGDANCVE